MRSKLAACLGVIAILNSLEAWTDTHECQDANRGIWSLGCSVRDGKILPRRCVKGRPVFCYRGESSLNLYNAYSNNESEQEFNHRLTVSGSAFFGLVSAGFESSFDATQETRNLDLTYRVKFESRPGVMRLSHVTTSEDFHPDCGDGFVADVALGSRFELVATLRFYDKNAFEKFDAKYDVSALFGAIEVAGDVSKELQQLTSNGDVFIDLIKVGGDRGKIEEISASDIGLKCHLKRDIVSCFDLFKAYNQYLREYFTSRKILDAADEALDLGFDRYDGILRDENHEDK